MSRNIINGDDARRYLSPSLKDLHNPFLLRDMGKAVHRVIQAIHRKEKIVIFGDYDADGITSVAVLIKFLRNWRRGSNITFPIVSRKVTG